MAKKPPKKRADKYEDKLKVNVDFVTILKAAADQANKKNGTNKKPQQ